MKEGMSMERQNHGFKFEKSIMEKYNIIPSTDYTAKWDGFLDDVPVSIKVEQYGSDIELADFRRNATNTEDFYLIVGFWEGQKDNIVDIQVLYISGDEWHELFPSHFIEDFQSLLDNITNSHDDDEKWKAMTKQARKNWQKETSNLVRPRFKRDHKTQKRIQCAINNGDFYKYFVPKYGVDLDERNH